MKKLSLVFYLFITIVLSANATEAKVIAKASSNDVTYMGRTQTAADGSVSYDWVGVYLQTDFSGGDIAILASDAGTSYHNLFIDDKWIRKIKISGKENHVISLAAGLSKGFHRLKLQKCTEGEFGCTTIHQFILAKGGRLKAVPRQSRTIEIYGDSYTCGYGSESAKANDPFKLETENCNKAYGCIIARYFDADYALIAHSGRGIMHNWGDSVRLSASTMSNRIGQVFDEHGSAIYDFKSYRPDLVMINLGTNDFSPKVTPTDEEYVNGYINIINKIRKEYGTTVPILCILPHSGGHTMECVPQVIKKMSADKYLFISNSMENIVTEKYDMGASYHPNYTGHCKIAMTLIPRISAITGWKLENKVIK